MALPPRVPACAGQSPCRRRAWKDTPGSELTTLVALNRGASRGQVCARSQKGITPAQLAIAWVLAKGDDLVPIPGTKRRTYLEENAAAVDVVLSEADLARIDAELPPVAGERYNEAGMATINL